MRKLFLLMMTLAGGGAVFLWLRGGGDLGQIAGNARDAVGRKDPATNEHDGYVGADAVPA